jgi:hypothetical protein
MAITINGDGTLTGISVGGLPDGIVDADMLASGAITAGSLPAGSILQVVQTVKTDKTSTTSTSPTAVSGLSASITPASTSSKILVTASFQTSIGTSGYGGFYYLYYNDGATTSVIQDYTGDAAGSRRRVASQIESSGSGKANSIVFEYLHSPAKDTSISYQVYFAAESSSYDVYVGGTHTDSDSAAFARMASTITLMEVAG